MVDALAYYKCQEIVEPSLRALDEPMKTTINRREKDPDNSDDCSTVCSREELHQKPGEEKLDMDNWKQEEDGAQRNEDLSPFSDEQCLLASPEVRVPKCSAWT